MNYEGIVLKSSIITIQFKKYIAFSISLLVGLEKEIL